MHKSLVLRRLIAVAISLAGVAMFSGCEKDKDPTDDNGNNTELTAANWQETLEDTYGVDFNLPSGWSFKEGDTENDGSHTVKFTTATDNFEAASTALAESVFDMTNAASADGNYTAASLNPFVKGEPLASPFDAIAPRSASLVVTKSTDAPIAYSWYYTGTEGVIAVRLDFASGVAVISLVNVEQQAPIGNGGLTIQNLPPITANSTVLIFNYSETVTSYLDLYNMLISGQIASGDIRKSTVELQNSSNSFSKTGTFAVQVLMGGEYEGLYFGQVKFTNGKATINYNNPTYDPDPCAPYHTGGYMMESGYGDYDGWPTKLCYELSRLGVRPPQVLTPHGYDFGYNTNGAGEATTIYISPKVHTCDDLSNRYELLQAIANDIGVGKRAAGYELIGYIYSVVLEIYGGAPIE